MNLIRLRIKANVGEKTEDLFNKCLSLRNNDYDLLIRHLHF